MTEREKKLLVARLKAARTSVLRAMQAFPSNAGACRDIAGRLEVLVWAVSPGSKKHVDD